MCNNSEQRNLNTVCVFIHQVYIIFTSRRFEYHHPNSEQLHVNLMFVYCKGRIHRRLTLFAIPSAELVC
jgi:hypothetical protein